MSERGPLRSEASIVSTWSEQEILVSVVCATFNHAQYLEEALQGFLAQVTCFPFEVIVHDDASTDETAQIIRRYAASYPRIIRPILQEENQYSKGGFKPSVYAASFAKGIYIALCEGDDYWVCDEKLQLQFTYMEENPELDFSCHSAYHVENGEIAEQPSWNYKRDQVFTFKDILESEDGTFAPTSSYVFRKSILEKLPHWFFQRAPVGDFFLELYGSERGGALYIDKPMSIYRVMAQGSWHVNTYGNDQAFKRYVAAMLESLTLLGEDFPAWSDSLNWKKAWLYTFCAVHYLEGENGQEFRHAIESSVGEAKYISKKQALLYRLRWWPFGAKTALYALRRLKQQLTAQ